MSDSGTFPVLATWNVFDWNRSSLLIYTKKCNSVMGVYFGEDVYVKGVHTVPNTRSVNYIQINEKRNRRVCF